jgi:hypothetical protein
MFCVIWCLQPFPMVSKFYLYFSAFAWASFVCVSLGFLWLLCVHLCFYPFSMLSWAQMCPSLLSIYRFECLRIPPASLLVLLALFLNRDRMVLLMYEFVSWYLVWFFWLVRVLVGWTFVFLLVLALAFCFLVEQVGYLVTFWVIILLVDWLYQCLQKNKNNIKSSYYFLSSFYLKSHKFLTVRLLQ